MIYFILGASGSGKTACLLPLKKLLPNYQIFDFDDIGVPENADKKWRQEATVQWLKRLTGDKTSKHVCLLGQMVSGEILASPSAASLKKPHILLLDCSDAIRIQRLKKRNSYGINQDTLNWAAWLRMHCIDPQWEQHVIKENSSNIMNFSRWDNLKSWDTLTNISIIDSTNLTIQQAAEQIANHINLAILRVTIRPMNDQDVSAISKAFMQEKFHKTPELFKQYLQEQQNSTRSVLVAVNSKGDYLGYVTIKWKPEYYYFHENNIPEISDLNVLPSQQKQGIGSELLEQAEKLVAKKYPVVGLGVGLFQDYGAAQSLYVKRGYVPTKEGITYNHKKVIPGKSYKIDDDCLLWMTKKL